MPFEKLWLKECNSSLLIVLPKLNHSLCYDHSPAGDYFFKFNYGIARTMSEICSEAKIRTLEQRQ